MEIELLNFEEKINERINKYFKKISSEQNRIDEIMTKQLQDIFVKSTALFIQINCLYNSFNMLVNKNKSFEKKEIKIFQKTMLELSSLFNIFLDIYENNRKISNKKLSNK